MERDEIFNRSLRLLGRDRFDALGRAKVIIFGLGGVGSWCAEGLVRSGITDLTLVDSDEVCVSNINRQLQATTLTVGRMKIEVLRERLLEINPEARITLMPRAYSDEIYQEFELDSYDYIIDAIDSLKDKISLVMRASATDAVLFSSMGSALKVDASQIKVAEFWNVRGCPLGAMMRKRMRQNYLIPKKKFQCVYSEEVLPNLGEKDFESELIKDGWSAKKAAINGTTVHITAIFGMTLCGLVVKDIYSKF